MLCRRCSTFVADALPLPYLFQWILPSLVPLAWQILRYQRRFGLGGYFAAKIVSLWILLPVLCRAPIPSRGYFATSVVDDHVVSLGGYFVTTGWLLCREPLRRIYFS